MVNFVFFPLFRWGSSYIFQRTNSKGNEKQDKNEHADNDDDDDYDYNNNSVIIHINTNFRLLSFEQQKPKNYRLIGFVCRVMRKVFIISTAQNRIEQNKTKQTSSAW